MDFSLTYELVKEILTGAFFGPPDRGVYSPAVQTTLYDMCKAVLARSGTVPPPPPLLLLPCKHP